MSARVVLAEDEAIIRLDLRETLEAEGYEVVGDYGRGDEALEGIRTLRPDIAILDVKMPGLDGLEVAAEILKEKICATLVLTAFSQRALVEAAREAGVMAYLVKPFQASELVPAIELAIARYVEAQALEAEVASLGDANATLEAKLQARKLLERAKGKLQESHGYSEAAAFRFIQKSAMDSRTTMSEVADAIVEGKLVPPPNDASVH
jgi:response regulator NasT